MNIPELPKYEKDIEQLEKYYKQAFKKVLKLLEKVDPADLVRIDFYEAQLRQITFIISELTESSSQWFEDVVTKSFNDSYVASLVTMGLADTLLEAKGKTEFSLMARERVEALVGDSFQDVLRAHSVMEENLKQRVRDVQAEVLREQYMLQRVSATGAKHLKSALLEEGFSKNLLEEDWKGITDAGGRRWDLTTYTQMVAKTKLQQAQLEGQRQRALENDSDLALISSHGASDACRFFEGMIISLEGKTPGYKTLAEVRESGLIFHPNCRHNVHTIGNLDILPEAVRKKADKAEVEARKAIDNKDEILKQDNARRYKDKKERLEMSRQSRRNNLAKAREAKRIERTKSSMVEEPDTKFDPDKTKTHKQFKENLYKGTSLVEKFPENAESVKAIFGDKVTLEGLAHTYNPDPSKYDLDVKRAVFGQKGRDHEVVMNMFINDKAGNRVGEVHRTIIRPRNGSLIVHNNLMRFDKEIQGAGMARDVYFKSEQLYKEIANGKPIDIELLANLDVGVYAWSKHGFDFMDGNVAIQLRERVEKDINRTIHSRYMDGQYGNRREYEANKQKYFKEELNKFGYESLDQLNHSWQFGALDNGEKYDIPTNNTKGHYGKSIMLEMRSWQGVKKLNQGHDSEIIGNLYFESKGVK